MGFELFVPGRVCLFGEHSDWAAGYRRIHSAIEKGYTIITGTNQGVYARVERHPHKLIVHSTLSDGTRSGPYEVAMERQALLEEAEKGGFFSYIAGVAFQIMQHYRVGGLVIDNYYTDLPVKKGLSSSAAISVLTARAFNRAYDLQLTVRGEMEYAYQGEITTPSRCGRMDQGCAFGQRPVLMIYDRDLVDIKELRVGADFYLVIVDLCAQKDTKTILSQLNRCFPFAEDEISRGVREYLGPINKQLVSRAAALIEAGDAPELGALMTQAQREFDRYCMPACPEELSAPALHRLLSEPRLAPHIWGGKGVGSQGDGCAQLLAKSKADQEAVVALVNETLGLKALKLDILAARRVRKAVIPAAGFGQHMFPASKAVKKELFPIVTAEGIAKPIIMAIIEEALNAGIEDVCLIVQQGDEPLFDAFLRQPMSPLQYHLLPQRLKEYAQRLREVAARVCLIAQESQDGLGHAVLCARQWVGDEPFLLLLGDHLYTSDTQTPCARQILEVYEEHRQSVVGLRQTPEERIGGFGTVAGRWIVPGELLSITEFVEKPTLDHARANLRVEGLAEGEYLTIFGQYVLDPAIFGILEYNIQHNIREHGLFQLTSALDRYRREHGFLGYVVRGRRYDIGAPDAYLEAVREFAKARV